MKCFTIINIRDAYPLLLVQFRTSTGSRMALAYVRDAKLADILHLALFITSSKFGKDWIWYFHVIATQGRNPQERVL